MSHVRGDVIQPPFVKIQNAVFLTCNIKFDMLSKIKQNKEKINKVTKKRWKQKREKNTALPRLGL